MSDGKKTQLPAILSFLDDKDALVKRFILSEVLGPPRSARRPGTKGQSWTSKTSSSSSPSSVGSPGPSSADS